MVSRICEEFNIDILTALRQPVPDVYEIMEMRSIFRAYSTPEDQRTDDQKLMLVEFEFEAQRKFGIKMKDPSTSPTTRAKLKFSQVARGTQLQ